jgi:hypothetical protein
MWLPNRWLVRSGRPVGVAHVLKQGCQLRLGWGGRPDVYVAAQVLSAMTPAALEVSLRAAAHAEAERAELDALWHKRLERAQYAADRARRQRTVRQLMPDFSLRLGEAGWSQPRRRATGAVGRTSPVLSR